MRTFVLVTNIVFLLVFILGMVAILNDGEELDLVMGLCVVVFIMNIRYAYKSKEVK